MVLATLLVLQTLCAVFFVADVVGDLLLDGPDIHTVFEAAVSLALGLGVVFAGLEMRRTLERSRRAEAAVSVASGAFGELIATYFERWKLTPAEADVALFALKGFDVAEIAELRGSAAGTVRAQLTRVYAKAGVSNRTQLLSVFTDDLLAGALPGLEKRPAVSSGPGTVPAEPTPPPRSDRIGR
jgi:DNA-binding CsgD family transcriptional regulator